MFRVTGRKIEDGFLTIKGFRRVKDLFSADELVGIVNDFLGFYGYDKVDQKLIINFCPNLHRIELRIIIFVVPSAIVGIFIGAFFIPGFWYVFITIFTISIGFIVGLISSYSFSEYVKSLFDRGDLNGIFVHASKNIEVYTNIPKKYIPGGNKKMKLTRTLIHELDHFLWFLEGKKVDNWDASVLHEARAKHSSEDWVRNILSKTPV